MRLRQHRLLWQAPPLLWMPFNHGALLLCCTTLKPLHAVSLQLPIWVLSLVLSFKAWVSVPSMCLHKWVCVLDWGIEGSWTNHLCSLSPFCLPQTCYRTLPPELLKLPFCPGWFPSWWGGFPGCGNHSSFTVPSLRHRCCPFFSLSSHPVTWRSSFHFNFSSELFHM